MTKPVETLDDATLAQIEAEIANRNDATAMESACGEYNCSCHDRLPALCATVRALQAKYESLKSTVAWHRDGVGPDVPVLQERYDRLIAQRNDLQSQLEQVTKERDRFSELADKRHDELCTAQRQRDDLAAKCAPYLEQLK